MDSSGMPCSNFTTTGTNVLGQPRYVTAVPQTLILVDTQDGVNYLSQNYGNQWNIQLNQYTPTLSLPKDPLIELGFPLTNGL